MFFLFAVVVLEYPDALGHPDNYIPANIFITPKHIVPEWYFLPFFAILRAIPNKVLGIVAMFSSILIIFILPRIDTVCHRTSPLFRPLFEYVFGLFILDFLLLGYTGTRPPIYPYLELSQICTFFYFFLCIVCFCLTSRFEVYLDSFRREYFIKTGARDRHAPRNKIKKYQKPRRIVNKIFIKKH